MASGDDESGTLEHRSTRILSNQGSEEETKRHCSSEAWERRMPPKQGEGHFKKRGMSF